MPTAYDSSRPSAGEVGRRAPAGRGPRRHRALRRAGRLRRHRWRGGMARAAALALAVLGVAACQSEPAAPLMPRIVMASPDMISRVDCPVSQTRCQGGRAVYDHRTGTIFLPTDWRADDETDVSTLLHEFAHHLQALAGTEYRCLGDAEKEAYAVQLEWLRARGHADPLAALGLSEMGHIMATTCRRLPAPPTAEDRRSTQVETNRTNS